MRGNDEFEYFNDEWNIKNNKVMIREKQAQTGPIVIDLTGPDGNSFALMGYAKRFAKQLNFDSKDIISQMMSGDYEHLLEVFDKNFGDFVILER
tara:strand:- start:82 stop:363 length:282 start_codon:yes stop_codon:yes gene_type:complete